MWEFIKYCLTCLGITISAAFGNNPNGMTLKNAIVGFITLFVLSGLALLVLYLVSLIVKLLKKKYGSNG